MNAKEYLGQLKKLDAMIKNKMIEREQWMDIAKGTTAQMGGERVQSSGRQQKMADAIDRYVDMDAEIDRCIDELIEKKKDVISIIEQLNCTEYDLLHKIYVQNIDLCDVADECGKTYSWVTTVHGRALKNVQNILDARNTIEFRPCSE